MDDVRRKTPEERLAYFQEKLTELITKTDIEPVPQMVHGTATLAAVVTLIDKQNPIVRKKYGLPPLESTGTEPPNPIAN